MDPEDVRRLLQPYRASACRARALRQHVEKFIGDAVMAVFGAPIAHEDDPSERSKSSRSGTCSPRRASSTSDRDHDR